ncbi:MAG: ZIP family metal transporter [Saccharofermentans sp.]|nr:ZIP family metal transporter [Saccharofermentans sp.]
MNNYELTSIGLLIPFLGTVLGSACVFFMKKDLNVTIQKILTGFAAGVMVAASIWSLIIPAIDQAASMGKAAVIPAIIGFWIGILFLLLLDKVIPHIHQFADKAEGPKSTLKKNTMMLLAVTIHNIPEGMAVGVVFAGFITGKAEITSAGAMVLALGIAIQNFPEGAIISMPLRSEGSSKAKAFWGGAFSGAVEPISAFLTILASAFIIPTLPYLLAFAAGAMLYVVVEELIPEMSEGEHSNLATIAFSAGFTLMMALDVVLG